MNDTIDLRQRGGVGAADPTLGTTALAGPSTQATARLNLGLVHIEVANAAARLALLPEEAVGRLVYEYDTKRFYVLLAGSADPTDNADWLLVGEGAGGSKYKWFGAGEIIPRVTSGAGINASESAAHRINKDVLEFDAAIEQFAQVIWPVPDNWTSPTFVAKVFWTATSGSGSVVWKVCAICYGDGATIDQARGAAQTVTDTLLATTQFQITTATPAVTPAGTLAAGNLMLFEFSRDATAVPDNLGANARLVGVLIDFT